MKKMMVVLAITSFLFSCRKMEQIVHLELKVAPIPEETNIIAFGSCNYSSEPQTMWDEILKNKPDLWIWLGDNIYGDSEKPEVLIRKYNRQLSSKSYQNFLSKCPVIGTWDDHDYGTNDGGKEYPIKEKSKELMLEFLDVDKSNPVYDHEGVYQCYDLNSDDYIIRVLLLDTRYFRDNLEPDPKGEERYAKNLSGTILGEAQWTWLAEHLSNSPADVNIIGSSIQVLAEEHIFEKWSNFPQEKERLLQLITNSKAKNPIILSGDRHMAELSMMDMDDGRELIDVTSSGLTHCWPTLFPEKNKYRQRGVVADLNFGIMKFDWKQKQLKIEVRGIDNKLHFDYTTSLNLN